MGVQIHRLLLRRCVVLIFILEEKQARQEKAFLVKVHTLNTVISIMLPYIF